ncbi:MAG: hypothetical protein MK105_15185 [Crocinitomicaceae bacterium]|nr:hypothetical protein [Crocinitomicaceae bacterium]
MIYKSIEEIPAKLFFKILETGEVSLLSTKKTKKNLSKIWEGILEQDLKLTGTKTQQKTLNVKKEIKKLNLHIKTVESSIYLLRQQDDQDIREILISLRYQFKDNLQEDLLKIENYVKDISVKIKSWEKKLPKQRETQQSKKTTFDQTVISYSIITELGFIDTNKITQSQFRALETTTKQKIATLNNGKKR